MREGTGLGERTERSAGSTPAERYLARLCQGTFLSLWSYPRLFRDQGIGARREGKEIADLIVVFEDDVIVFSDKHCAVPASADTDADWARWFRKAVCRSADQAWGAERWLRAFPNRVFLDKSCRRPFPLPLPDMSKARFHLIVVAHEIAERCASDLDGSGSLMIRSDLKGPDAHTRPFVVGDLDPARPFVHVLDDTSLRVLMRTLDTIADFTAYLRAKERLLRSGQKVIAAGEEELLALYLTTMTEDGEHGFDFPSDGPIWIPEGHWARFMRNPQRHAQIDADRISYVWDRLIETFGRHALQGTEYYVSPGGIESMERILRFMAQEPRFQRRLLGAALHGLVMKTPIDIQSSRVLYPSRPGDPFYVFVVFPRRADRSYDDYRVVRRRLLEAYCAVVKARYPEAQDVIGVATEPAGYDERSEDAAYLDARNWTAEDQTEALRQQEELGILKKINGWHFTAQEYPGGPERWMQLARGEVGQLARNPRNKPCPCGSGAKYKKCHGRWRS